MWRAMHLTLGLAAAASVTAAEAGPVEDVIRQQTDAFIANDVATAFTYASPAIRTLFGSPEVFGRMVRQGYPMVWRPAELRFLGQEERGGRLLQTVMVTDASGVLHILEYEMIELDGAWRINGVRIMAEAQPLA